MTNFPTIITVNDLLSICYEHYTVFFFVFPLHPLLHKLNCVSGKYSYMILWIKMCEIEQQGVVFNFSIFVFKIFKDIFNSFWLEQHWLSWDSTIYKIRSLLYEKKTYFLLIGSILVGWATRISLSYCKFRTESCSNIILFKKNEKIFRNFFVNT